MIELPIAVFNWTVKVRNGERWVGLLCFGDKMSCNFGWVGGGGMRKFLLRNAIIIFTFPVFLKLKPFLVRW